jgi:DNA invertase Pin-like site-specific DNA recombinase
MPTTQTTRRAAKYRRVSRRGGRDAEALERTTLREQDEDVERALPRDAEIVVVLDDVDVSGTLDQRPGLDEMWEMIERGEIDLVIVGYLSRFGRSAVQIQANVRRLLKAGVGFISAREGLVLDPHRPNAYQGLLLAVLASMAEIERDKLRDGLASANRNAIADGVAIAIPYGYRRANGPGSPLQPDITDASEIDGNDDLPLGPADIVRRIFAWRIDGIGASEIAQRLNHAEITTPTTLAFERGERRKPGAQRWTHGTVRGIVTTHTYKGVIPRWSYETGESKRTQGKTIERRIDSSLELLPAEHTPLVSEREWQQAQFKSERRTYTQSGALLVGLVRCVSCSRPMTPGSTGRTGKWLTYHCRGGAACPRAVSITRSQLDPFVERFYLDGAGPTPEMREIIHGLEHKLDTIDERVALAETRLITHRDHADMGPDYYPVLRRLRSERDALDDERADIERALKTECTPRVERDLWERMSIDERHEALVDALDAVIVGPAPGRGHAGKIEDRVLDIVLAGQSPIPLSRTGRIVQPRRWPVGERC